VGICTYARIPVAYDFPGSKGSIAPEQNFVTGDSNYRGRRFEIREEVVREGGGGEGGDDRSGRVWGVGVVLVEVACGLL